MAKASPRPSVRLAGIDFTSSPSRKKPITIAEGRFQGERLEVDRLQTCESLDAFSQWLRQPGPWLAAFDLPFGLPRAFVDANRLGSTCAELIAHVHARCPSRLAWRAFIDAWGNTQPAGRRLLHRVTDESGGVSSTSPLQTRYVPVGLMYYEGVKRLVDSGVSMPGLHEGDPSRIALEGYPRRLAHAIVERRSYKNSEWPDRTAAREAIVSRLEQRHANDDFALDLDASLRRSLIDDASGDRLDAVLCLVQAARASALPGHGVPADVDPVEGWIVG